MKRYSLLLVIFFIFGCAPKDNQNIALKINNYKMTQEEFEGEFRDSPYAKLDTPESRKEFLNNLINRKLLLQEAEAEGLDKQKNFLRSIEKFWEQSLLKIILDSKTREIAASVQISDQEIETKYKDMVRKGETTKNYQEIYRDIKWQLTRAKQSQVLNDWIDNLKKKSYIEYNKSILKEK